MNILYLTYWSLNDGLTASTVLPHIRILERNKKVKKIILCTIERDLSLKEGQLSDKVWHNPWVSSHRYSAKVRDFATLPKKLAGIIKEFDINVMFCRGTPAGAIGHMVSRKTGIPYVVESFEPHADYMRESGVWSRWDPRYLLQRYWEKRQLRTATYIIPVSHHYYDDLIKQDIDRERLFIMPCAVDLEMFAFNMESRLLTRQDLGLPEDVIVGVYVGKFGGMYFDNEAFHIFASAKKYFGQFFLLILSPDKKIDIALKLHKAGYLPDEFSIKHIRHAEVPHYLSASDFAFATYKPGHFKRYLSPVKVGEYWASGLPVLLTDGIGDDHVILEELKIGSVFSVNDVELQRAFFKLSTIMKEGRVSTNAHIQPVAARYRNFRQNEMTYNTIIEALS